MSKMKKQRRSFLEVFSAMSTAKKVGVALGGAAVGIAVIGVASVALKLSKVKQTDIPDKDIVVNEINTETLEGYTNIALFGGDSREGALEEGTHSDCIIVASINNQTKEVRMVSVYRDTFLDQTDGSLKKANNAYFVGGPKQAINMLNMNLDLDIKDYATVDFAAVSEAVDLLGGVEIDIKDEEVQYMNEFIDETAQFSKKESHHITKSGLQKLDGPQATTYARIRSTAGSDFTRTERQRLVIEKMAEKAKEADLSTLNKIIDKVLPTISTSYSSMELMGLAKDAMSYSIGQTEGFPFENTTATLPKKGSVVIPTTLEENVVKLHEFLFDEKDYQPSEKVKEISTAIAAETGNKSADPDSSTGLDSMPSTGKSYQNNSGAGSNSNRSSGSSSGSGSSRKSGSGSSKNKNTGGSKDKESNAQDVTVTPPKPDKDTGKKPDQNNNDNSNNNNNNSNNNNKPKPDGGNTKPDTGGDKNDGSGTKPNPDGGNTKPDPKPDDSGSGGNGGGSSSGTE